MWPRFGYRICLGCGLELPRADVYSDGFCAVCSPRTVADYEFRAYVREVERDIEMEMAAEQRKGRVTA